MFLSQMTYENWVHDFLSKLRLLYGSVCKTLQKNQFQFYRMQRSSPKKSKIVTSVLNPLCCVSVQNNLVILRIVHKALSGLSLPFGSLRSFLSVLIIASKLEEGALGFCGSAVWNKLCSPHFKHKLKTLSQV